MRTYRPNSDIDTLCKRVLYGGRKGKSARKRLADWSARYSRGKRPRFTKYQAYCCLLSEGNNNELNIIAQYRREYKRHGLDI